VKGGERQASQMRHALLEQVIHLHTYYAPSLNAPPKNGCDNTIGKSVDITLGEVAMARTSRAQAAAAARSMQSYHDSPHFKSRSTTKS